MSTLDLLISTVPQPLLAVRAAAGVGLGALGLFTLLLAVAAIVCFITAQRQQTGLRYETSVHTKPGYHPAEKYKAFTIRARKCCRT